MSRPIKLLHFADAHIDMSNYGRHDPATGLPMRVMDFLRSLDVIVDAAIAEQVDLVLFAGDAYKDRSPQPTFQREWSRRIMRLSRAGIPTLLLVGNHDLSPSVNRAHALDPFTTLEVPNVWVLDKPALLTPQHLGGLGIQIIALPWITRSGLLAQLDIGLSDMGKIHEMIQERLDGLVSSWLSQAQQENPDLPLVLLAHATVQGAVYGGERTVMLGDDLVLPGSLVKDPRLDYVALGHIHKAQNLNEHNHPPVVYPGSIERVDFGEASEDKFFVFAHVARRRTTVEWRKLDHIRPFRTIYATLEKSEGAAGFLLARLAQAGDLRGAVVRMIIDYPRQWEHLIDENALHAAAAEAFEFHLVKRAQSDSRIRLPEDQSIGSLSPLQLLDLYWKSLHLSAEEIAPLQEMAKQVITQVEKPEGTGDETL